MTIDLRLVLGVGRSGTTWLASLIGRTSTPLRFLMEGLYGFTPRLDMAPPPDHTAAPWVPALSDDHPLRRFYNAALAPDFDAVAHNVASNLVRNDTAPHYVLVKEVHGLLSTGALLSAFPAKVCFIHRNPIYSADSLFHRDGLGSIYLDNEARHVRSPDFLDRYFGPVQPALEQAFATIADTADTRRRIILEKTLTMVMINVMMEQIAASNPDCLSIRYETLCLETIGTLGRIMAFMGLTWGQEVDLLIEETSNPAAQKGSLSSHYPIFRDSRRNSERSLGFITDMEVDAINDLISQIDPNWA